MRDERDAGGGIYDPAYVTDNLLICMYRAHNICNTGIESFLLTLSWAVYLKENALYSLNNIPSFEHLNWKENKDCVTDLQADSPVLISWCQSLALVLKAFKKQVLPTKFFFDQEPTDKDWKTHFNLCLV